MTEKKVFLVGVAHILHKSQEDVEEAINEIDPESIAVELDRKRYWSMKQGKRGKRFPSIGFFLGKLQQRMAKKTGNKPGKEMLKAVKKGREKDLEIIFADKPQNEFLNEIWERTTLKEKIKILIEFLKSFLLSWNVSEEEIEDMKEDADELIEEFGEKFPKLKNILVDERNAYMAKKIAEAPGEKILVIVGAGHLSGLKSDLESKYGTDTEVL